MGIDEHLPTKLSEFIRAFNESLNMIIQEVASPDLMEVKYPPREFGNDGTIYRYILLQVRASFILERRMASSGNSKSTSNPPTSRLQ